MSEKMLRVALKDLQKIRVKCKGQRLVGGKNEPCGMTYEIAVGDAWVFFHDQQCPRCNQTYTNPRSDANDQLGDPLKFISKAIESLKGMTTQLEVEFDVVLPH